MPDNAKNVLFLLEINVGEVGEDASDIFQVVVATLEGLKSKYSDEDIVSDRSCIVMKDYSWKTLCSKINLILKSCENETWVSSVTQLQKYFQWEYEDYKHEVYLNK